MALSKKHFTAIAKTFAYQRAVILENEVMDTITRKACLIALQATAERQADFFCDENAQFDYERFLRACGF